MGSLFGWHCNDCGAGESFGCGTGMRPLLSHEIQEDAANGSLGPAMQRLFKDGIPEGWTVSRKNDYYLCPNCGGIIDGASLRIDDGSGAGWLDYHLEPEACKACGCELVFWDDHVPLSERELQRRCEDIAKAGCPKCGSKHVSVEFGNWD